MQQNERNASGTRSPRGKSPSGRMSRWPCKDYLKGTCTNSFCEKWHPPECLFCKSEMWLQNWGKVLLRASRGGLLRKLTHQIHDNWVAYSRIWSRRSLHRFCGRGQTYGNQSDVLKSQKTLYVTLTFETKILRSE